MPRQEGGGRIDAFRAQDVRARGRLGQHRGEVVADAPNAGERFDLQTGLVLRRVLKGRRAFGLEFPDQLSGKYEPTLQTLELCAQTRRQLASVSGAQRGETGVPAAQGRSLPDALGDEEGKGRVRACGQSGVDQEGVDRLAGGRACRRWGRRVCRRSGL